MCTQRRFTRVYLGTYSHLADVWRMTRFAKNRTRPGRAYYSRCVYTCFGDVVTVVASNGMSVTGWPLNAGGRSRIKHRAPNLTYLYARDVPIYSR